MKQPPAELTTKHWASAIVPWALVVVLAIAVGIYAEAPGPPPGITGRVFPRMPGPPESIPVLLYMLGVGSFVWFAVTIAFPFLLIGARRVDLERRGMSRVIVIAIATIIAAVSLSIVAQYFLIYTDSRYRPSLTAFLPEGLRQSVVPWIAIVAIVFGIEARRRGVQSRIERERLRAQIAEQQLIALTAQLHPHFLFNTLQSISTLIHRDPEAADEMLGKLSDLLRDVLRHRDQAFVSLGEEIRYARTYLEIAQIRFADRMSFSIDVPPDLHSAAVPLFILQPLVENAIGHGIGGQAQGGSITIRGRRSGDRLVLDVIDNGAGISGSVPLKEGIGLSNTRERLRASYSADQSMSIQSPAVGGTTARIDVPFRALNAVASQ